MCSSAAAAAGAHYAQDSELIPPAAPRVRIPSLLWSPPAAAVCSAAAKEEAEALLRPL